nr:Os06g0556101 [Ipomoea trifida]
MNRSEPLNGSSSSDERYNEASPAQDLQPYPSERVLGDLGLRDVHLNREPEEVDGVSAEAWNIHIIFCGYEFVVWPSLSAARLDEAEYWLAKNLETENPDEMDGDADVGEVDQPEGLVEAETGEEVSGSIVSKRGVAKATT